MAITKPQVHQKYVNVNTKGNKILHMKIQKALYGMMKSALQFTGNLKMIFRGWDSQLTHMIHAWQTRR